MSQPEPAEDWLPTATVAAQLKVSERTVNRWANEGILPIAFQAPGATGARFFRAEDVRRLADDRIARFMPDLTAGSAS
ncbi:MAG: helix-turn-helix domain-containing protein [Dehalococcoidia bacterium]|jgi:DNA-binding transcriptional MerR regulator|nr:helix-turn-helix domain-containing protein [Dehalococcoidia bacterium]